MRLLTLPRIVVFVLLVVGVYQATVTSGAGTAGETLYVITHVDVIPPFAAAGRAVLKEFAAASRTDPGAIRIEVCEELGRPNHSTVVEVWKDRKLYESHLAAEHTRAYRAKLQPMLGSPFDERLHSLSSPVAE